MITTILDGGKFDDIKAIRIHKIVDGGGSEKVSIKDLTKDELMDITRTYYLALQEMTNKLETFVNKLEKKFKNKKLIKNKNIMNFEGVNARLSKLTEKEKKETIKTISRNRKLAWIKQKEDDTWNHPNEKIKRSNRAKNKRKISHTEKSKQNMRKGWAKYKKTNSYNSTESKNKRSSINKGKIPWNKGTKGKMVAWNKGRKCTKKEIKQNSVSQKKAWKKRKASGKSLWSKETQKKKSISMKKFYKKNKK